MEAGSLSASPKAWNTSWLARHAHWLPWFSLAWALTSGFLMRRDFASGWRVALFFFALLIFSVCVGLWFLWRERPSGRSRVLRLLTKRAGAVEWLGLVVVQMAAQHIILFSLVFLFFARAWFLLGVTAVAAVTALWDPWWAALMKHAWYESLLRGLAGVLVTAFLLPVLFPASLSFFDPIVGIAGMLGAVPLRTIFGRRILHYTWYEHLFSMLPLLFFFLLALVNLTCARVVPPLSIWIEGPSFGYDVVERQPRTGIFEKGLGAEGLGQELAGGHELCCFTPVVAPPALRSTLTHEWYLGDRLIDRINLNRVSGLQDMKAFRTFSCKRNFPGIPAGETIHCRAVLADSVRIGGLALELF